MVKRRKPFTLIELLVAVGLLSLIMMLLFQLFSGAQKIWIASEKTNNVYADARVAMERMADIINTVQFSRGEDADGNRDKKMDGIFSLTTGSEDGTEKSYSSSIIFAARTSRFLQSNNNEEDIPTSFFMFRRGKTAATQGKLFEVRYFSKNADSGSDSTRDAFYRYFPTYKSFGNRGAARRSLKTLLEKYVDNYSKDTDFCKVIADNVVSFKLVGYRLDTNSGVLTEETGTTDDILKEPPYMIEIQLTLLDPDSYKRWNELSGTAKSDYLLQHQHTFTRNVFIGDRWALEAK